MRPFPQIAGSANRILHLLEQDYCTSSAHIFQIQAQLILQKLHADTSIAYSFINACQSFGLLDSALLLYSQLRTPHVFICNTLIRAFSHSQSPRKSISLFSQMHKNSVFPNNYTFPFVLKSLSDLKDLRTGESVHTHVVKLGHLNDIYVQNSVLNLYGSCGKMGLCQKVFDEMPERDVVSWTVMITGFRESGMFDDALIAFEQMQNAGVVPNRVTMVNALAACANFGALEMGVWIHGFVKNMGWELDVILGTSLISMYGKCGRIEEGLLVFEDMKEKNLFTWNTLIKGLALAKNGREALHYFNRMEQQGVKPDEVTLIGVLCACAHSGLLQIGQEIFSSMINGNYGVSPGVKHYACMVDMLARSGCLEDAFSIIKEMPFEPTKSIWGAFFMGCRNHGNLEMCEFAAWKLIEMSPGISAYYVVLSNLYAEMGRWSDVENVRRLMKEKGFKKELGCSSVELESNQPVSELLGF